MVLRSLSLAGFFALLAFGCGASAPPGGSLQSPPPTLKNAALDPSHFEARLPTPPGEFAPSRMQLAGTPPNGGEFAEVEACAICHPDVVSAWKTSAHAYGSFNNPVYRSTVDRTRREVGKKESRFCGGCHDISVMVDGAMMNEIDPKDPRAHAGITCRTCHGISEATNDGNGSYTLIGDAIPIPSMDDPESIKQHVTRVAMKPLRTVELCTSCHRAFLDETTGNSHHLPGMDDSTPWGRSPYAGSLGALLDDPVEEKDCRACHMTQEPAQYGDAAATDGKIASHRFLGGHTWLASMRRDAEGLARVQHFLKGAASIDVSAAVLADGTRVLPADGAPIKAGETLTLDVTLRNQRVGHRFPGGVLDAQDVWIEVVVTDAQGEVFAQAGVDHATQAKDPSAHILQALQAGEGGVPQMTRETHRFRAVVWNHTLAPREAAVAEYQLKIPADFSAARLPLKVKARLLHRTRNLLLQEYVCKDSQEGRGKAFLEESAALRGEALDPCAPQPITEVSTVEVWLGKEGSPAQSRPDWLRLYEHGLGMSHALQERVGEGIPSLEKALSLLSAEQKHERAMVLAVLASIAGRQGRVDDAGRLVDQAEALEPGHPALDTLRGEALSQVWRWKLAIAPLREAAEATPRDPLAWVKLAAALGSAGEAAEALSAAQRGLLLEPRNADLLRSQGLALEALGSPLFETAIESYLVHRPADEGPGIRAKCSAKVEHCARDRNPVHVHELLPAGKAR
jgi:tetratricopeptide (TPR) repeat protein